MKTLMTALLTPGPVPRTLREASALPYVALALLLGQEGDPL